MIQSNEESKETDNKSKIDHHQIEHKITKGLIDLKEYAPHILD